MSPVAAFPVTSLALSRLPTPARARSPRAVARGRKALLELARRHGEVRLRVGDGLSAPAGAADLSDILSGLNDEGLLRYGGLHDTPAGRELVYLPA